MNDIYFYYPSQIHSVDRYKMSLLPEDFSAHSRGYDANVITKRIHGKKGLKQAILSSVNPAISRAYNQAHIFFNSPKKRKFHSGKYDLVYSSQCLLDTNLPYLLDMEHPAVFCGFNQYALDSRKFTAALKKELESSNLKKILPMSETAKRTLFNFINSEKIAEKTETLYPVAEISHDVGRKPGEITFLFIGKIFYEKGGFETLMAFDRLSRRYDVRLNYLGPVPDGIREKYSKNEKISFYENIPYSKVLELFQGSHCLVFPSKFDTLGFVAIEAFSHGLPVITIDSFALPELVTDGKLGIVLKSPFHAFREDGGYRWPTVQELFRERERLSMNPPVRYLEDLYSAMEKMVLDSKFRNALSLNALKEAREGRFSPSLFRRKMARILEESLS